MNLTLTPPQAEFFQSTAKATAAVAGFGSGKTQTAMTRMISTMMECPGADMLYAAPTIPLIRDILWAKLQEALPEIGIQYTINKAESIVHLHGLGRIFCRSMEHPERLVGFEVLDAFLDELDILNTEKALEVFRKVKARCRQKGYFRGTRELKKNQQFITTTPEGYKATYELFEKNPVASSHLVQMSTYSNAHNLPEDYIDDLLESYPEQLIAAYLNGEFVNLVSAPVWAAFHPDRNAVNGLKVQQGETLHIGQDFNVGRGCAVVYVKRVLRAYGQHWPILAAAKEVVNSFDTPDTARVLNEWFPTENFSDRRIYPDTTGMNRKSVNATETDLTVMKHAGFKIIEGNKKNTNVKDRVATGNAGFYNAKGEIKVYVDPEGCPNLSEALVQQVYDKNGLPEKGAGKFDDLTDAATYPVNKIFPIKRASFGYKKVSGF